MPNLLANPRKWKTKAIFFKGEADYGVDPTPTGLLDWVEASNVSLTSFEAETVDRGVEQPYLGNTGKLITSIWSKLSFEVPLAGSGVAGTAPKCNKLFMPCGFAETVVAVTSVTNNLVSDAIESACAYMNIDGVLFKFIGLRGDVKVTTTARGRQVAKFEFTSLYTRPIDTAMGAVDRTGWTIEDAVNATNTGKIVLAGADLAFESYEWALNNKIQRIDLPGPQREVVISDRAPSLNLTVLAPLLAVFNPYALADSATATTLSNTHGLVAGKKVKQDFKGRIISVAETEVLGMAGYKLGFEPLAVAGNDEIAVQFL